MWDFELVTRVPPSICKITKEKLDYIIDNGLLPPVRCGLSLQREGCWSNGKSIIPLPDLPVDASSLFGKLNERWGINWSADQWGYRFKTI